MFKSLKDCPLLILTCTDVFGIDLDKETGAILQCLQSNFKFNECTGKASLNEILFRLITGIIEVIERQMYDYIEGNYPTFQHLWQVKCSLPLHIICLQRKLLD